MGSLRGYLSGLRRRHRALSVLKKAGYDAARVDAWARSLGPERTLALELARDAAVLETQPYFKPGIWQSLWKGTSRDEALLAAADNCLYGLALERKELSDWQNVPENAERAETAMVRALNESVLHAVRFCGGWSRAYAGGGYPGNPAVARMAEVLERCPGRALDIGAGGMPFYPVLKERPDWIASDLNLPALRIMRAALGLGPEHFVCHDAQVLPFPDSSFEVIISRYVIENVLRPKQMLCEVSRALSTGGSFILLVPRVMFRAQDKRDFFTNRKNFPSRDNFESWCREAGMTIEHFYETESVYHLRKSGKPDDAPPEGAAPEFRVDGIAVRLPERFVTGDFGTLKKYADKNN